MASSNGIRYQIEADAIYTDKGNKGQMYGTTLIKDKNSVHGFVAPGDGLLFRGATETTIGISLIPEVFVDNYYGDGEEEEKGFRLQYGYDAVGSVTSFETKTHISNSSESECRSVDFLDDSSDCYLTYYDYDDEEGLRYNFIKPALVQAEGVFTDISDNELVFSVDMTEKDVQLSSTISQSRTVVDYLGNIGGVMSIASGIVIYFMNTLESAFDPEGKFRRKMRQVKNVAKDAATSGAAAAGLYIDEETPDVIFSEYSYYKDENKIEPDEDYSLPDLGTLIQMSQKGGAHEIQDSGSDSESGSESDWD
mmetsp:Transcript_21881/g.29769  ORF Transcript_21881/g.29769 Transcript_21881/m.29769 type:complete len:308 (-) Transcript_21881:323-1246(-)